MILKELDTVPAADRFSVAGHRAEQQLAFYLMRGFGRDRKIHVLNDVRLEHDDDAAQIDHLILHPYGFIVIESKSVHDKVEIDRDGRWRRWFRNKSQGMPSPIRQAERQIAFLRTVFDDRCEDVLGTFLGLQQKASARNFDLMVAISDGGEFSNAQPNLAPLICKADEVVERIQTIVRHHKGSLRNQLKAFSLDDMDSIATFLVDNHRPLGTDAPQPPESWPGFGLRSEPRLQTEAVRPVAPPAAPSIPTHSCGKCQETTGLRIQYGPYGYYFKCGACGGNTRAQTTCETCGKSAKIRKQGLDFFADCQACGSSHPYFTNPAEDKAEAAE